MQVTGREHLRALSAAEVDRFPMAAVDAEAIRCAATGRPQHTCAHITKQKGLPDTMAGTISTALTLGRKEPPNTREPPNPSYLNGKLFKCPFVFIPEFL